jgi:DNA invertase Pin-like site-specific DNA recombinase
MHAAKSAAIYARVSKVTGEQGRSVGQQDNECRAVVEREGWRLDDRHVFVDDDRSASRYARGGRPGFEELQGALRTGAVGVLVLWESSRGSRRNSEWAAMLELCRDRGVLVHVVVHERTYDPRIGRDMKTLQQDGVDSEYEAEQTRVRILRDVRTNAAKGRPHGRLLYGYRREYEAGPKGAVLVGQFEEPGQAAVVRELARRLLSGESCYAVAKDLNTRGVPTASKDALWTGERIKRLMINPGYAGLRVLNGEVIGEAIWKGIITRAEHERLVARLTDPARRTVRDPSVRHMLTSAARCGVCDSRMRVQKMTRGDYLAYVCAGRPPGNNTGGRTAPMCAAIKAPWLEGYVRDVVLTRYLRPDAARLFVRSDSAERVAAAQAEVGRIERRLAEVADEVIAEKMSPGMAAKIEAGLLPQLDAARERARPAAGAPPAHAALTAPGIDVEAVWDTLTPAQRREIITAMMTVKVLPIVTRANPRKFDPARVSIEWLV